MRFRDRPLLPGGLDAELYVPRRQLERDIAEPLEAGRNVLVLGEPGSGKSTILRQIASSLEATGHRPVLVGGAVADDPVELLSLVDAALDDREADRSRPSVAEEGSGAARLLRAARGLARDQPAVILLDDLANPDIGFDLFGRLRDELWGLGHTWLVALRPRDSAPVRTPPADAFWGRVVEIPPLDDRETAELLKRGLTTEENERLDDDRLLSGAHPRFVIRWAEERLRGAGSLADREHSGPQWLLERAGQLGRSQAIAMIELQGIARPVSAHDPELLDRLGWSRAYAQRILSNLEEHHLLRSIPERRDAPGRPRKLYEINPTARRE